MKKLPVIFIGHGSPMIAISQNELTKEMNRLGDHIIKTYEKPKGILSISAHWYTKGSFFQADPEPRQIYDMYGFPKELYEVQYPVQGDCDLSARLGEILQDQASVSNDWGVDHGSWSVLVHIFPEADIPLVQLSVDATKSLEEIYQMTKDLEVLRSEGYLIMGSGNIVHNLRQVQWDNPKGTDQALAFNEYIVDSIRGKKIENIVNYQNGPHSSYAVPSPDHYLPLVYALGSAGSYGGVEVFNNKCELGSISMASFVFN